MPRRWMGAVGASLLVTLASASSVADVAVPHTVRATMAPDALAVAVLRWAFVERKVKDLEFAEVNGPAFLCEDPSVPVRASLRRLGLQRKVALVTAAALYKKTRRSGERYWYYVIELKEMEGHRAAVWLHMRNTSIGPEGYHPCTELLELDSSEGDWQLKAVRDEGCFR